MRGKTTRSTGKTTNETDVERPAREHLLRYRRHDDREEGAGNRRTAKQRAAKRRRKHDRKRIVDTATGQTTKVTGTSGTHDTLPSIHPPTPSKPRAARHVSEPEVHDSTWARHWPGPQTHRAQQVTSRGNPRRRMQKTHLRSARTRQRKGLCGQQHPAGGCDVGGQGTGHVLRAAGGIQIQPLGESAAHLGQIRERKRPV